MGAPTLYTLPAILGGLTLIAAPDLLAQDSAGDGDWRNRLEALDRKVKQLEETVKPPAAATAGTSAEDLVRRVDDLDQQIRILGRRQELGEEAASAKAKDAATVTAGKDGFGLRSGDGQFRLRIGGVLHVDARGYLDNDFPGASPDTFVIRRLRPVFEGTLFGKFGFRFQPEWGNGGSMSLLDGYVDANLAPSFRIRAGKMKGPVGLERLQSPADIAFVERAFPTQLLPNRDVGVQVFGDVLEGRLTYAAGYFNGVRDGASADTDANASKDFNGRLFAHPFRNTDNDALRGLGIGVAVTTGTQSGTAASGNLSSYLTPGQQTFFSYATGTFATGERQRWSPQFYYYAGPLGVMGEYAVVTQAVTRSTNHREVTHRAWQLYATWVLTGEDASFTRVTPRQPFDADKGSWGAFEIGARVSGLDIDGDVFGGSAGTRLADPAASARKATDYGVVVNWYLNRSVKVQVNYDQTRFQGGATGGRDLPDERVLITRFQAAF